MKLAIIGSGISGLTAAHLLHGEYDFTVFEAGDHVGGHTHTVRFDWQGGSYSIDTGFIVYNEQNYPLFSQLLAGLGVATQPTSMSFSVQCERSGLEYRGADLSGVFAQRRNLVRPSFWNLLREMQRFNRSAERWLSEASSELTVAEFFERHPFSESFREQFFLPMASAIWSCPASKVHQFPIRFIVEFYRNHGLMGWRGRPQWRVISGGSDQYVRRLIDPWRDRIRLRTPITTVRRTSAGVLVKPRLSEALLFDHVIMACHSDQALRLLGAQSTPVEREILSAFPYERNEVLLHTDSTVLPRTRRAWASWNYFVPAQPTDKATVTYYMNRLQGFRSDHPFCVTLNDCGRVRPDRVIRAMTYHHPVFNAQRGKAQARHSELIDHLGISYCGAYWGHGFHEDGVRSALSMVRQLREKRCTVVSTRDGCDIIGRSPSGTPFATASV